MTTEIILTGTGVPIPDPKRAGAGTLVRCGGTTLQFDAGRNTVARLIDLGVRIQNLTAVFITHHHSDHLMGLQDLALTRWTGPVFGPLPTPLPVVAPEGPSARFVRRMLDIWKDDIEIRNLHTDRTDLPGVDLSAFEATDELRPVWQADGIRVLAALVRHRGVEPAVGYRVETPDGVVAISGDTVVCEQVERLAEGADVLVHEIMRPAAVEHLAKQSAQLRAILAYHADSVEVGALAARLGVPRLLLTHLIPQPRSTDDEQRFVEDVRKGGYTGEVLIGPDLTKVTLG